MRPLKTALTATLAALSMFAPAAMAGSHPETPPNAPVTLRTPGNSITDHMNLIRTLARIGVRTKFNDKRVCMSGNSGVYFSHLRLMVICQDRARSSNRMVEWTNNDLDTLRHEAHHVVQDCVEGRLGDTQLGELFANPEQFNNFVISNLGHTRANNIAQRYGRDGKDQATIFVEVEAFAVAYGISARTIANKA
jgi:hypothetical protein